MICIQIYWNTQLAKSFGLHGKGIQNDWHREYAFDSFAGEVLSMNSGAIYESDKIVP